MNTKTHDQIDAERLEDFKKVLTYHLVNKIAYHFKGNVETFYKIPAMWKMFRAHRLSKDINPWSLIAKFNSAGLTRLQVASIFGKYPNEKSFTIPYSKLIEADAEVTVCKHGSLVTGKGEKKRRIGKSNCYLLPKEYIASIFADEALLKKVKDAGSDFYSDRQRRLIFTQINKQKNYHYKTNAELTEEEKIAAVIDSIEI